MTHLVFVYGTLQTGGCRETTWPRRPRSIRAARTRGALYDLGSYPAMIEGDDWIGGQLWEIADSDLKITLARLDAEEGFANRADDLYVRRVIICWDEMGREEQAMAYLYARPQELPARQRIRPNDQGLCLWTANVAE